MIEDDVPNDPPGGGPSCPSWGTSLPGGLPAPAAAPSGPGAPCPPAGAPSSTRSFGSLKAASRPLDSEFLSPVAAAGLLLRSLCGWGAQNGEAWVLTRCEGLNMDLKAGAKGDLCWYVCRFARYVLPKVLPKAFRTPETRVVRSCCAFTSFTGSFTGHMCSSLNLPNLTSSGVFRR